MLGTRSHARDSESCSGLRVMLGTQSHARETEPWPGNGFMPGKVICRPFRSQRDRSRACQIVFLYSLGGTGGIGDIGLFCDLPRWCAPVKNLPSYIYIYTHRVALARHGTHGTQVAGTAQHVTAWNVLKWHGMARYDLARFETARQGTARYSTL